MSYRSILPPYLLKELAKRNPKSPAFLDTLKLTEKLFKEAPDDSVIQLVRAGAPEGKAIRIIYSANNTEDLPGTVIRSEKDKPVKDKVVNDAFTYHGNTRDFYAKVFKRNSVDDKGMNLIGTVHYSQNYDNAFWDGSQMIYGDGDGDVFATFVLIDVIGHEMSHGVTQFTSNLDYEGQSGALNEHFSDVMGVLVRQFTNNLTVDKDSWLIGPGIFTPSVKGRALRDMLNPGTAYDDPRLGKDPQPASMDGYVKTDEDNGGVHLNSGIPNRAFALFAKSVGGYAWEVAGQVWYNTNSGPNHVDSNADFKTFAAKTVEVCTKMFPTQVRKLKLAWAAVGIHI